MRLLMVPLVARMPCVKILLVCVLLVLGGCNTAPIAEDINQFQANEIVAVLATHGINAQAIKESGGKAKFRVEVKKAHYSEAVSILHNNGLPSEARPSFNDLIASRGLMPDSREVEALRLDRALASEIEESLQGNPAIISVHAIVRFHAVNPDPLAQTVEPQASVSLKVRRASSALAEEVKQIVHRALPGIVPESVLVTMHEAADEKVQSVIQGAGQGANGSVVLVPLTNFLWIWRVPENEYNSLAGAVLVGILIIFLLGTSVGWSGAIYRRGRSSEGGSQVMVPPSRRLPGGRSERAKKDLPEP